MHRVQNDAEAGRGESSRTAWRCDGGVARVWWEEGAASSGRTGPAGPVPRRSQVGVLRLSSSLRHSRPLSPLWDRGDTGE